MDRKEYTGSAWELVEEAFQYVLRNIRMGATFKGVYRQDVYEIPPFAIRELIVNAVVHRSYVDRGNIQIAVYDDRLEILSPGKLPKTQTFAGMKKGRSKIRNEALAKAFSYMKLMEKWGSGIPRVVREVCDEGLAVPVFEGGEVDLVVNIYRKGIGPSEDRTATDATNSATNATDATEIATNATELTEDEKLIIVAVKQNPSITQQALHNQTGITIGTIKRILPRLQEKGVLNKRRKSPFWKLEGD